MIFVHEEPESESPNITIIRSESAAAPHPRQLRIVFDWPLQLDLLITHLPSHPYEVTDKIKPTVRPVMHPPGKKE